MKKRIELAQNTDVESFSGGTLTGGSLLHNAIIEAYPTRPDEARRTYVTQRPAIAVLEDASMTVSDTRGRGVYFWETTNARYFVNDDTVYKDNYSATIGTITAGKDPVWMGELGSLLIIIDRENNQGWTITSGDVLVEITDPQFPTLLAGGGALLDSFLFLMDTSGTIYQSGLNDATTWDALDVLNAEREPDDGVYIGKMLDHVVAFGTKTIEFFYDAGNPTGSVLKRRQDVSYRLGSFDPKSFYNGNERIYFLSSDITSGIQAQVLENFKIQPISSPAWSAYFTYSNLQSGYEFLVSGMNMLGHEFVTFTAIRTAAAEYVVTNTAVYDGTFSAWGTWETTVAGQLDFPLVQWSERTTTATRAGGGIFLNGDVFQFTGSRTALDTFSDDQYIADDYWEAQDDYIFRLGQDDQATLIMITRTTEFDAGIKNFKFQSKLELVGERVVGGTDDTDVQIRWTDDRYNTFTAFRNLDISKRRKLTRGGQFNRRAYEVQYTGTDEVRFEALEVDIKGSDYA